MSGPRGIVVAAPASGSGKTTITLGLLRHFSRNGIRVAPFKVGPDYIDPAFHHAASGLVSLNLDGWAMRDETLCALAAETGAGADLILGEGVMGLFDGASDGTGSTADLAARAGWPVLLVVDTSAQGASAAAVVYGFRNFRDDVQIAGVVFNRVGSARHREILVEAIRPLDIPVFGCVPRTPDLELPERHLGLVQASEQGGLDAFLDRAALLVAEHIDTDAVMAAARPSVLPPASDTDTIPPLGARIAVARDDAFRFAYPHVLGSWRRRGAEIVPFSPLADDAPDQSADAVYLPGGYPELHAGKLAANAGFLDGLRDAAGRGAAIYGECGGYMVLGAGLTDGDGKRHEMAGLLPVETSFAERRLHLGYRAARLVVDTKLGPAGTGFRGHEFHYAGVLGGDGDAALFDVEDASGRKLGATGSRIGGVMGSFMHLVDRA